MEERSSCGIAIIGCGTVGGATADLLLRDREFLAVKTGAGLDLKYIVDVDFSHAESLGLDSSLFETDLQKVLADESIQVIVELVGGTAVAKEITEQALSAGKAVVTANKALLAHHGLELFAIARENSTSIAFEAACGGGIPIVRALYDGLIANRTEAIYGIVNGTCNYILTQMVQKGRTYEEVLEEAQAQGLAEADPTLDVSGHDSAHKIAILGSLAFGAHVQMSDIAITGIDTLDYVDVAFGSELGYVVKLLAVAEITDIGLNVRVRPAFISTEHPLAWVSGPFNAVSVYGHAVGHTMYYGRGAGGSPTASAVISDIVGCALGTNQELFRQINVWPDVSGTAQMVSIDDIESRYYIRTNVVDKPGVFAQLASTIGSHGISISAVLQKDPADESGTAVVPVVITTHTAREGDVRRALAEFDSLDVSMGTSVCISIMDEREETLSS